MTYSVFGGALNLYSTLTVRKCCWLTDADAFAWSGGQDERDDGDDWEETAGKDEIDDVVERLATDLHRVGDTRERWRAAVVIDRLQRHRHVCSAVKNRFARTK